MINGPVSRERRTPHMYESPKLEVLGSIADLTLAGVCKTIAPNSDGTYLQLNHKRFNLNHCTS
jgi:hypothetical protein